MIKPPFTIIVIKSTQHPVTLRVSRRIFFGTVGIFLLAGACIGFALNSFLFQKTIDTSFDSEKNRTTEFVTVELEKNVITDRPEIERLYVVDPKNGEKELRLDLTSFRKNEKIYVWIIINPDAETAGELVIYPRNPIFKGLPVDYRNGIMYLSSQSDDISINITDAAAGINLNELRILVYSSDGELIVDQYFSENQIQRT